MWEMDEDAEELAKWLVGGPPAGRTESDRCARQNWLTAAVVWLPPQLLWAVYKLAGRRRCAGARYVQARNYSNGPWGSSAERWLPGEAAIGQVDYPDDLIDLGPYWSDAHCARLIAYAALGLGGPTDALDVLELARTTEDWRQPARVIHVMGRPPAPQDDNC